MGFVIKYVTINKTCLIKETVIFVSKNELEMGFVIYYVMYQNINLMVETVIKNVYPKCKVMVFVINLVILKILNGMGEIVLKKKKKENVLITF